MKKIKRKHWLIVFAKEPELNKVKTRLALTLSAGRCLALYKAFLKDTLRLAEKVNCDQKVVAYSSSRKPAYLYQIAKNFNFCKQRGKDLGERMHRAAVFAKKKGAVSMIIIGSDAPTLPVAFIDRAFNELKKNDLVLGPTSDGGYYLIGLNEPDWNIFKEISWSSNRTFLETLNRAKKYKKKVAILSSWYDVDDQESLNYLINDLRRAKTKKVAAFSKKALAI